MRVAATLCLVLLASSTSHAQPEAAKLAIAGTVEDADGYAVEGAFVVATPPTASFGETPPTASSDQAGKFELSLTDATAHSISVRARGYVTWRRRGVEPGAALRVVLERGEHAIEGVVLDGNSLDPVAGARVEIVEAGRGFPGRAPNADLEPIAVTTDDHGAFRIDGLGPARAAIAATARGYGRALRRDAAPGKPLQLFLFPGSSLTGRVLDVDEKPVEGARVQLLGEQRRRFRRGSRGGSSERTGEDGTFEILGVEPGTYHVLARHDELAPALLSEIEVAKEESVELDVLLTGGVVAHGRLLDEDERPVSGKVTVDTIDGVPIGGPAFLGLGSDLVAESDETSGEFTLPLLPAGRHGLSVAAPGFARLNVDIDVSDRDLEYDLGDVVLETGLAIQGHVVDENEIGIPGARLLLFAERRGRMGFGGGPIEGKSAADGSFVVAGLESGRYRLVARAPGFGSSSGQRVTAGDDTVSVVLEPAGSIEGSVVDIDAYPVSSLRAMVRAPGRRRAGFAGFTNTEAVDGTFLIEDVAEGTYVLEVSAPDFLPEVVSDVEVTAGNVTDVGQLRLKRGGSVRGTVTDPSGQPVAGASVSARSPGERGMGAFDNTAVSDVDGFFFIQGLRDGPVELVATHESYAEGRASGIEIEEAIGVEDVDVVLQWGGTLEGYVRTRDGMGLAGRLVRASVDGSGSNLRRGSKEAESRADGYFAIERLPLGTARVELFGTSGALALAVQSKEVEIWEGTAAYVEFETRQVIVQGQLTRRGAPLAGAQLTLHSQESSSRAMMFAGPVATAASVGPQLQYAETRPDGSFELFVEQPGTYTANVVLSGSSTRLPAETVAIPDIDVHAVTIDFGGSVIRGVVIDKETDEPIATAFVSASAADASSGLSRAGATTEADGSFELELEPGAYELQTYADGYATGENPIDVGADGGARSIRIALEPARHIRGRVVDGRGRAMAGMLVIATEAGTPAGAPATSGTDRSLADGSFRVDGLARKPYNVLAGSDATGYGFRRNVRPGGSEVDIAVSPGGRATILVTRPDGEPAANARVSLTAIDGASIRGLSARTRSDGTASLSLPAGAVELLAVVDQRTGTSVVQVQPGTEVPVEIRLREPGR